MTLREHAPRCLPLSSKNTDEGFTKWTSSVSRVSIQLLEGGGYQFDVTCMGYQDAQPLRLDDVVVVKNSDRTGLLVERHHDGSRYHPPHSPYKKSKSLISGGFPEIGVYSLFRR